MRTIKKIQLVDTIEMNKIHPDTFQLPPKEVLDNLKVGDTVKVCNSNERFWCIVDDFITDDLIVGVIDNQLLIDYGYGFDDKIFIHKNNIYDVFNSIKYELEVMDSETTNENSLLNNNQSQEEPILNKFQKQILTKMIDKLLIERLPDLIGDELDWIREEYGDDKISEFLCGDDYYLESQLLREIKETFKNLLDRDEIDKIFE